jgi:hypothetical protein
VPRYYLHICNGFGFIEDEEGQEFADSNNAREAAIIGIRDLLADELRRGEINIGSFIEIEDEARRIVMTISFAEAVAIKSDTSAREPS